MDDVYNRLPAYMKDYIYEMGWDDLRDIQKIAFDEIYQRKSNVILTAGTASGKTEAAFIPALTELNDNPSDSIGILYISPLKALINDQFVRIEEMVSKGNVPLFRWHGDVSASNKHKAVKISKGIMQTTPESLEMLITFKKGQCSKLFSDLHYIIIDEMHYFMDSPRGTQLLSVLERIQRLVGIDPVRIGLSATLGDYDMAQKWLDTGSSFRSKLISAGNEKKRLGILLKNMDEQADDDKFIDELSAYLYDITAGKKSIIFVNSRALLESIMVKIRERASAYGREDLYCVHHGDISAGLREDVENKMKHTDEPYVTGATVTLELGIDIGQLDLVVQVFPPLSVSSFAQRAGRCGRRGQKAEIVYVQKKDTDSVFEDKIDWEFLRGIAIMQLFLTDKWVEPIKYKRKPFSVLYHQTMLVLKENGEMLPSDFARTILTMGVFGDITQEEFKILLVYLLKIKHLEKSTTGMIRLSEIGEKLTDSFKFCAVFEKTVDYEVITENGKIIGSIMLVPKENTKFVLAGRVWICERIEVKQKRIVVKESKDSLDTKWFTFSKLDIHDRVLQKMAEIVDADDVYRYLDSGAKEYLLNIRTYMKDKKLTKQTIYKISKNKYAILLWVGTPKLIAIKCALIKRGFRVLGENYYLLVQTDETIEVLKRTLEEICSGKLSKYDFVYPEKIQLLNKYNEYIPDELLKIQYIEDYIEYECCSQLVLAHT